MKKLTKTSEVIRLLERGAEYHLATERGYFKGYIDHAGIEYKCTPAKLSAAIARLKSAGWMEHVDANGGTIPFYGLCDKSMVKVLKESNERNESE